ncbi:ATP-grasp domain-containing protein [Nonomuraea rubra]|uniref:ATP-grasp domain-containing protein n=1 Tax=Nonomuraea rubra TaxID=46180 RepID=UPI0033DA56F0
MPEPIVPRLGVCHRPDGAANLREVYVAAQDVCEVVMLVRAGVAAAHPDVMRVAERFFECHVLPERGYRELVASLGLRGVTTFHDDELELADELHAAATDPAMGPVADPWDKYVQRRLLNEHGLTSVGAVPVDEPEDLVKGFAALGGRPCVLKPRRAAGGQGVAFLDDEGDVRRQLGRRHGWAGLMLETRIDPAPHPTGPAWLGSLVSVETLSAPAGRVHLGVLDKLPVAVTRGAGSAGADAVHVQGDILPSCLPEERCRAAEEYTGRVLDVLGVRSRLTHTELLITATGFELLEVNGRLAGHTARLFRLLDGPDLVAMALRVAAGQAPEACLTAMRGAAAGVFPTFADRAGPVRTSLRRRELRALPGVCAVDELAEDGAPKSATQFRMANVTLRAGDRPALDAAVARVLRVLEREMGAER